jgi:hypothetical protein
MQIIKSTNGFPYAWRAGRVEYLIRSILESKAQAQLDVDRVMIINPTWLQNTDVAQSINDADPDFIICHNFADPAVQEIFSQVQQSGRPYIVIGSTDHFRLDFWAMVCDLYFQHYQDDDLKLAPDAKHFVCYNRKPHPHRVAFVDALIRNGLRDQGHLTLGGNNAIVIDESFNESQGINDEYGNSDIYKIRNDIFSVGDLSVWNRSALCFVTETDFDNANPQDFFISEKTWKPIIGLRPFLVVGQAPLRQYLKDSGFDIFEDLFDYSQIDETQRYVGQQAEMYAEVATKTIAKIQKPFTEYQRYFYRCQQNKKRFCEYTYEQWDRLNRLDLTQYVTSHNSN